MKLIQDQSPWAEDIQEFGEINFDKLLHLLTGFRSIAREKWDDFEELNGVIDRLGQGNLTTLMQKVKIKIIIVILKYLETVQLVFPGDHFNLKHLETFFEQFPVSGEPVISPLWRC